MKVTYLGAADAEFEEAIEYYNEQLQHHLRSTNDVIIIVAIQHHRRKPNTWGERPK